MWAELVNFDICRPARPPQLQQMVAESVAVKERIVTEDPTEQGIRKALNLGHAVGPAFESWPAHCQSRSGIPCCMAMPWPTDWCASST